MELTTVKEIRIYACVSSIENGFDEKNKSVSLVVWSCI